MSDTVATLKRIGREKLYGENSLTAGEVFFTFAGAAVIVWGHKLAPGELTGSKKPAAGIALIVLGEAMF